MAPKDLIRRGQDPSGAPFDWLPLDAWEFLRGAPPLAADGRTPWRPALRWIQAGLTAAHEFNSDLASALIEAGIGEAEARYDETFHELWDVDDEILRQPIASLADLVVQARVVAIRMDGDPVPPETVAALLHSIVALEKLNTQ